MGIVATEHLAIQIPSDDLERYCRRWKINKLELFGSVLRDDFRPESDVDFLVTFADDAQLSLLDIVQAQDELSQIVNRPVDLVERDSVEASKNWIRRKAILSNTKLLYVA